MLFCLLGVAFYVSASVSIIRKDLRDFVRYFFDDGITFPKLKGAHFSKTEVIFLGHYVNW